ncbi:MAG: hypothetical protein VX733_14250 [Candidatus Latescibacterota bacterium]|nr:hypothetical protein [Candidatus Latescibacterota bacterium]
MAASAQLREFDLATGEVRTLNQSLHDLTGKDVETPWRVLNPGGRHAIAAGLTVPVHVEIKGHVGYYCAGMNQCAEVIIEGMASTGVAENMMSGLVRIKGNASQCAGATGHGGLLVIEGDASSRCGISMKGIDIVVQGSVGHMSCFMAQAGRLVVCGDADDFLGDSIYEAQIFVRGQVKSLGADCIEKPIRDEHVMQLANLLERAEVAADPGDFRRYGSARKLYNFNVDHASKS